MSSDVPHPPGCMQIQGVAETTNVLRNGTSGLPVSLPVMCVSEPEKASFGRFDRAIGDPRSKQSTQWTPHGVPANESALGEIQVGPAREGKQCSMVWNRNGLMPGSGVPATRQRVAESALAVLLFRLRRTRRINPVLY